MSYGSSRLGLTWLFSSDSGRDFPRGAAQKHWFYSYGGITDPGAANVKSSVVTKALNSNGGHRRGQDRHAGPGLLNERVVSPLASVQGGRRGESYHVLAEGPCVAM